MNRAQRLWTLWGSVEVVVWSSALGVLLLAMAGLHVDAQRVRAQSVSQQQAVVLASIDHWSAVYGVSAACEAGIIAVETGNTFDSQAVNPISGASGIAQWTSSGVWLTSDYAAEGVWPLALGPDEQVRMLSEELSEYGAAPWRGSAPRECA